MITEFCAFGNLRDFLVRHRKRFVNEIDPKCGVHTRFEKSMQLYGHDVFVQTDMDCEDSGLGMIEMSTLGKKNIYIYCFKIVLKHCIDVYVQDSNDDADTQCIITSADLVCWSFQVAQGMNYLARQGVLHGDLAARNILLADENVVKICDFGFSRWMRPEQDYQKETEVWPFF